MDYYLLGRTQKVKETQARRDFTSGRFGKLPNEVATMKGLSPEATSYIAVKSIFPGDFGLNEWTLARRFRDPAKVERRRQPETDELPSGMGRDSIRAARAELRRNDLLERKQSGRSYCRDTMLIEADGSNCRHVPLAWVDDDNPLFSCSQFALLVYVRACHGGATPGEIDGRFGWSRPTTNKYAKSLMPEWLANAGTVGAPRYVCAKDPAGLKNAGRQTPKKAGAQGLKNIGRTLTVSLDTQSNKTQGSQGLKSGGWTDGNRVTLGDRAGTANRAEGTTGSALVSAEPAQSPTVSRALIDRAHAASLDVPALCQRLAEAVKSHSKTSRPLDAPAKVDRYFSVMIDNEQRNRQQRCPVALPTRSKAQIIAEHGDRAEELAAEVGVVANKVQATYSDLLRRQNERFSRSASVSQLMASLDRGVRQ